MPPNELRQILKQYEQKYGHNAREYAEQTLPKWRSENVTMSGVVASRLFNLLPPCMPLSAKYSLVENLWRHYGPSSKKSLLIGIDADLDTIVETIRRYIEQVVVNYKLPENLEWRFDWLSAGDVQIKQQLLNHFRGLEKSLVIEGAKLQIPVMLEHLRNDLGWQTHHLAQVLTIGKHQLELLVDRRASGVKLAETAPSVSTLTKNQLRWLWWVVAAALLVYWLTR